VCCRRCRDCRQRPCVLEGGRRAREASLCFCSAAGCDQTGGGLVRRGGELVSCRRCRYRRRRLCVLRGGQRPRKASEVSFSAAGVDKIDGGRVAREGVLVCCRRRRYGWRRLYVDRGGVGKGDEDILVANRGRCRDRRPVFGMRRGPGMLPPAFVRRHVCGVERPSRVFVRGYLQWQGMQGKHEGCCAFVVGCVVNRSRKKSPAQRGKKRLARYRTKHIHMKHYRD